MPGRRRSFLLPDETIAALDRIAAALPKTPRKKRGLGNVPASRTDALIAAVANYHEETMGTMKVLIGVGVSPANPAAPVGYRTPSGARVVEVTGIPAGMSAAEICLRYAQTVDPTGRESVAWDELGPGKIVGPKPAPARPE